MHRAFGQPLAVLSGDALIVLAFQTLAQGAAAMPARLGPLMLAIGASVGVPCGIVAGQAWECEDSADLAEYQREKTGALFAAATIAGAASAGADAEAWRPLGALLGEAFQAGDPAVIGKPVGQDLAHQRPSAVRDLGLDGAIGRLQELAEAAVASVPACRGQSALRSHILSETVRLLPQDLARSAA